MLRVVKHGTAIDAIELVGVTLAGVRVEEPWPRSANSANPDFARFRGRRPDGASWVIEATRATGADATNALDEVHSHGQALRALSGNARGIPEVIHFGVVPGHSPPVVALVRAFVVGKTLEEELDERRARGEPGRSLLEALAFLRPLADTLGTLQSLDGHHGSLEPSAIVVGEDRAPRLLCLGSAMLHRLAGTEKRRTARHAAPEQVDSSLGPIGPRVDVFALALVYLELVSGAKTFLPDDGSYFERLVDRARRPSLRDHGLLVAEPVERVLSGALAVDPRARPASAAAFVEALSAAIRIAPHIAPLSSPPLPRVRGEASPKKRPRLPTSIVLATAVTLGLVVFGVESILRRRGAPSSSAATSSNVVAPSPVQSAPSASTSASESAMIVAAVTPPPPPPPPTVEVALAGHLLQVDRTEVTVAAYRACIDADVCVTTHEHGHGWDPKDALRRFHVCNLYEQGREDHPVNCVTYAQAATYCGYVQGRLPTGREFTAAATSGEHRRFPWGNETPTCEQAVFARYGPENWGCRKEPVGTASVSAHPATASPAGAVDLAGNLWEWTDVRDGPLAELRGGGWDSSEKSLTVDAVLSQAIFNGEVNVGFRCVYDVK